MYTYIHKEKAEKARETERERERKQKITNERTKNIQRHKERQ